MAEEKQQEHSFELRSEKVRSIVGQIPSSLVRYGISAIAFVLIALFAVAYFLPYKQVYSGDATVYVIPSEPLDSIETTVFLKFNDKRPALQRLNNVPIVFQSSTKSINGLLLDLSSRRDTIGRQEALCRIPQSVSPELENSEVDFILTIHSGTLLDHLFSGLLGE
ncbi:MAG: hypothetical protein WAR39_10195 [Prevotella sp.]